jgi:RNA polymerase sigma-70 factor (ECF subfamily)
MAQPAIAPAREDALSDTHLVDRVRRGDRAAEYELYRAHAARIHRLIYRLCGDEELTNDLLQESFVKAFARLGHFRGDAAFGTWLHRIAINLTLNARRSLKRRERWLAPAIESDAPAPLQPALDPDFQQALGSAIDALSAGQREVFVMFALEGYTHVEIAELLGISEGTSKGRLFHARLKLKQLLARFAPEA